MRSPALCISAVLAGCAMGAHELDPPDAATAHPDNGSDSQGSDAGIDAPPPAPHGVPLLLSEISLGPAGREFIEIVNPTAFAVPLADLYLCDNGNYFKLPAGVPTLTSGDFLVKFPQDDIVAAHTAITIATDTAANFTTAYGAPPTYSIADANLTVLTAQSQTLTDSGEVVVLFQWDGSSPLVRDVDIMIAGAPTAGNTLVSKSGYAQLASSYKADAMAIAAQPTAPASGKSTKRIALEAGHETQEGTGNGASGDDETSEQTGSTWDTAFAAPTPGQVPAALLQ